MIGTNDLAYGKSVEHVIENHKKIMARIKEESPKTKVYIESVLPVDDAIHWTRPNTSMLEINKALKAYCKELGIKYIDLVTRFLVMKMES